MSKEREKADMHFEHYYSLNNDVGRIYFFYEMILTCLDIKKSSFVQNELRWAEHTLISKRTLGIEFFLSSKKSWHSIMGYVQSDNFGQIVACIIQLLRLVLLKT